MSAGSPATTSLVSPLASQSNHGPARRGPRAARAVPPRAARAKITVGGMVANLASRLARIGGAPISRPRTCLQKIRNGPAGRAAARAPSPRLVGAVLNPGLSQAKIHGPSQAKIRGNLPRLASHPGSLPRSGINMRSSQ